MLIETRFWEANWTKFERASIFLQSASDLWIVKIIHRHLFFTLISTYFNWFKSAAVTPLR